MKNLDSKKIKGVTLIFALILAAYFCADIISISMKKKFAVPLVSPAALTAPQKPERAQPSLSGYVDSLRVIFPESGVKDGKNANLKLRLAEIFNSSDFREKVKVLGTISSNEAKIVIFGFNNEAAVVSEGERIGGYKVSSISRYKVSLIDASGRKVILYLGGSTKGSFSSVSSQERTTSSSRVINRHEITAIMGSPGEISKEMAFAPVQKDSQPYGLMISQLNPKGLFSKLGLRPRDTLISINNQNLRTSEDFFKAYQIFNNESSISLKIDRDGQVLNFNFNIR